MIYAVRCDKKSFKPVTFKPGMNVVLAERTKDSSSKDSRNGLGKTTLIEIIHFCLGSSFNKRNPLSVIELENWTFFLDIDIGNKKYTISRNTSSPNKIYVQGNISQWPLSANQDEELGQYFYTCKNFTKLLGILLFGLEIDESSIAYSPKFRSLISYFARKERDAYTIPFEYFRKQLSWDKQVHNLFLLGLDWRYAREWQCIREQEKSLKNLKSASKSGLLDNFLGTLGELHTLKYRKEEQVTKLKQQINSFQVHPQYKEIENEASRLTRKIHNLANENVSNSELLEYYKSSFDSEQAADNEAVSKVYSEAGIELPGAVIKRITDVIDFHKKVVKNREGFLHNEIANIEQSLTKHQKDIIALSQERANHMAILNSYGALDEYAMIQEKLSKYISELEEINNRIKNVMKFDETKSSIKIQKEQLRISSRADLFDREEAREKAITYFDANSEALYDAPGKLIIDVGESGFLFQVEIERSGSQGINQMKVFCYDLMLSMIWSQNPISPMFLIHDSTIFDGVDERQVATALEEAGANADKLGFQYICCLNSDTIPDADFSPNFDLLKYVRLILTDATPEGGLLGIRF